MQKINKCVGIPIETTVWNSISCGTVLVCC